MSQRTIYWFTLGYALTVLMLTVVVYLGVYLSGQSDQVLPSVGIILWVSVSVILFYLWCQFCYWYYRVAAKLQEKIRLFVDRQHKDDR